MKRREFIIGATTASVGGIAGCAGITSPDMEFQNFVVPDPRVVTVDTTDNEYFATIQNRGDGGEVRLELWYFQDSGVPDPSAASMYLSDNHEERYFDLARTRYFNSEERREVSITGDSNPPIQSESREFGITPWAASHGAVFKNTGSSGEVEFKFEYRDTHEYNPEEPSNKIDTVGSDDTIEIIFETVVPPGAEYEILAEPI